MDFPWEDDIQYLILLPKTITDIYVVALPLVCSGHTWNFHIVVRVVQ